MVQTRCAACFACHMHLQDKIYTVLVLAGDPAVEVKGAVQEVALKKGASATWWVRDWGLGSQTRRWKSRERCRRWH